MTNEKIIIYDFDGTLTPYALPKFEILEKCGLKDGAYNPKFLEQANEISEKEDVDLYTAIYKAYFSLIKKSGFKLIDENFCLGASSVDYNPGILPFLQKLNSSGVKNYVLSSGIKVFLSKTKVASFFADIYATTFTYNQRNEANGIKFLMSDKNKVNAIKEICKINGFREDDCSNIIYIGDGFTDYYAMDYVKNNGGITIFVYQNYNNKDALAMKEKGVVSFSTLADFSIDSELNTFILKLCNIKTSHSR